MLRAALAFALLLLLPAGLHAAALPCYPAKHYAAPAGAPYTAEEVEVPTRDGYRLAGTLTIPRDAARPLPATLLITGSGPQTRDLAIHPDPPLSRYQPFRQIADALSRRGIAVLRLDDRGVACSASAPNGDPTMPELANDSRDALAYLRGRAEIAPARIALLGESEGADMAIMIAVDDPSVAAIVAMAGAGGTGLEITKYQHRHLIANGLMSPEEKMQVAHGTSEEAILAARMRDLRARGRAGKLGRWMQFFLTYNPLPTARKLRCPALILQGSTDTQIPVDHAQILGAAIRSGGDADVTVKILPGLNHLFLEDPDGTFTLYGKLMQTTNQLPPVVLRTIGDWLAARLGTG